MFSVITKLVNRIKKKREYSAYIKLQRNRSFNKVSSSNAREIKRKEKLVELTSSIVPGGSINTVLVIGCRNSEELDMLGEKYPLAEVLGIDLFSIDNRIQVMDMHRLTFESNSFNLIYCSHSLEHAYDYTKVVSEIFRVATNSAFVVVEVPINYNVQGSDLHDFRSHSELLKIFEEQGSVVEVLHSMDLKKGVSENLSGTDVCQLIIKI